MIYEVYPLQKYEGMSYILYDGFGVQKLQDEFPDSNYFLSGEAGFRLPLGVNENTGVVVPFVSFIHNDIIRDVVYPVTEEFRGKECEFWFNGKFVSLDECLLFDCVIVGMIP